MAQKILWACVNKNGTLYSSGGGLTAVSGGKGFMDIVYQTPFLRPPAVVATQNYREWTEWGFDGGDTRDNCVLVAGDSTKCKIATGNGSGKHEDRNFTVMIVGEV